MQSATKNPVERVKISNLLRCAWPMIVFGLAYLLLSRASLYFFVISPVGISLVWPPSGLALAMMIVSRQQGWRFALVSIYIAIVCADLLSGTGLLPALGYALAVVLEAWLMAMLCKRYLPDAWQAAPGLSRLEQVLALFAVTVIGTACSALLGAAVSYWAFGADFGHSWLTWWVSDALGIILFTPLILAWARPVARSRPDMAHLMEGAFIILLQCGMAVYLFFSAPGVLLASIFRVYMLLPIFTWVALRFGERFNLSLLTVIALIAIWGTNNGMGEFAKVGTSVLQRLLSMQVYLLVVIFFIYILYAFLAERKRVDARMQESSDQYRLITSTTLDGFWVCDQAGILVDVNNAFCHLLAYERDELLGMDLRMVDNSGMDPWALRARGETGADSSSDLIEAQYRGKDGRVLDVEISLTFISNPERCLAFVRDISERKLVERIFQARLRLVEFALGHSLEDLLTATLDEVEALSGSKIGFYHFLDEDQVTLSLQIWSTRTLREYCTGPGRGTHYSVDRAGVWVDCVRERKAVIHNDYASLPHRKGYPEGHADVRRELVVPILRGERIVCILGVGNKLNEYNQRDVETVTQLADLSWDITERKRTELALQKNQFLLRDTQSISGVGGWEYDAQAQSMLWTDEVYRIYGVSREHDTNDISLGLSFYSPEDRHRIEAAFQASIEHGTPYDMDLAFINGYGQYRWVSTRGNPVSENGKVIRVTGNIVDITARKMAEQALLHAYKNLELQMEANKQLQDKLLEQATHDSLTALYNRRFMEDALRHELARAAREGYLVSVLMLDIDYFKPFNDTYGHEAGDQVLVTLGKVLRENIRDSDFACRYGGEEFVIILPRASLQDARARADLIRENFSSKQIAVENYLISSSVSVGVACYPACETRDELLRAADAAMYIAKQTGRNRVCMWSARNPLAAENASAE